MYIFPAKVIRVIDGDTFEARLDLGFGIQKTDKFRVKDLDTPELFRPQTLEEKEHAMCARNEAEALLLNQNVFIETHKYKTGKYGRYLATITLDCGANFAHLMRSRGLEKRDHYGPKQQGLFN